MELNHLSDKVLQCAFKVHTRLGPGLLESVYQACMCHELNKLGIEFRQQVSLPVVYDTVKLEQGYRIDILIEENLVLELKAKENLTEVDFAQTLTYLKVGGYPLGLLLNFHVRSMKNGIKRVINTSK